MKKGKYFLLSLLAFLVLVPALAAGCLVYTKVSLGPSLELDMINEAWQILYRDYVDQSKLDTRKLTQGAIKGMMEAVGDPYTHYLTPETFQLELKHYQGKFSGIGAEVTIKDGQLQIVAPIAGSPAEKAGLKPGDKILEIDGVPTAGMSLTEAVLRIRGPAGTAVTLLIQRVGEATPVRMMIVRAEIEIKSVSLKMHGEIAYIKVSYFSERTPAELISVLESPEAKMAAGIIFDLRQNPGGSLQAVVEVASQFLEEGMVVTYVVDNQGKRTPWVTRGGGLATNVPLVVLVNEATASGSEVLAGALQDHGRAKLAGSKTYGKGSVNVLRPLRDGSALFITTARWLTPNGKPIEGVGLVPDYPLQLKGEEVVEWALDYLRNQITQNQKEELLILGV